MVFFYGVLRECLDTFVPVKSINCKSRFHCPTPWLSSSLSGINNVIGRYRRENSTMDLSLSSELLNNYFRSAAVTDNHQPATTFNSLDLDAAVEFPFRFSTIDRSRVLFLLKNLDEKKSVGPDGLSARFLKEVSDEIVDPLTKLFNKSLQTGVFPNEWKHCNVTPVHKGGASDIPGNYRPISVVPVVAKVLERMVAQQLHIYFEDCHGLTPFQCAYQKGKSTEQLLLIAVNYITQALDDRSTTCVAFLDLRKAFDSLDHHILLRRLNKEWHRNQLVYELSLRLPSTG